MARAKIKTPVYEDYNYLFFTVKYQYYDWQDCIHIELYLVDRYLTTYESRIVNGVFPAQEMLNARAESIIFDKLELLFTGKFAREDHEHSFVAR